MDGMDELDEEINEEDIAQVIELDDNGVIGDAMGDVDLNEGDDEGMEASGVEMKDMADLVFDKHTDVVYSISIDPKSGGLVLTGAQDDRALVWDISTGQVLLECTGHKDSVTCTGFSHDGMYIATADLSGIVKVWKVSTKEEVFSFDCSDAEWMKWHPEAHVLLLGTVDGEVWMWKIPSGDCKTFQSPGSTATCGTILPDGKRVCVGYDDGTLRTWDLKSASTLSSITGSSAHQSTITCIDSHHDNSLVVSGSTDVTAKLVNSATGKVLAVYDCAGADDEDGSNSVETVGFCHTQNFLATGTVSGIMHIWDINTQQCRIRCEHEAGIVGLRWDRVSPLVYTSSLDGVVRLWDSRSGQVTSSWTGHTDSILGFDISSDGGTMVTVSEDKTARVFSLSSPDR